jgi:hypothetical protein
MAISTYAELQTAAANWLNRSDLTARLPEFIALAEAQFNRRIRAPQNEATATQSASTAALTSPTDYAAPNRLYATISGYKSRLPQVEPDELRQCYDGRTGSPQVFAIIADTLTVGPTPDTSYSFTLDYYRTIPALASNSTNWLLTRHPDLYLYATLLQAEAFGWNDERIPLWRAAVEQTLEELRQDSSRRARSSKGVGLRSETSRGRAWDITRG